MSTPAPPFQVRKIGHVVLRTQDLDRAVRFYTELLGFRVSDVYPDEMVPGGMVFMRCNADHHGVALVGGAQHGSRKEEMDHLAFEVATLEELFRAREFLKANGVRVVFDGRRRAGCQIAVEFLDPDDHHLELYWNIDQIGSNGAARPRSEWHGVMTLEDAVRQPVPGQDTALHDAALAQAVAAAPVDPRSYRRRED